MPKTRQAKLDYNAKFIKERCKQINLMLNKNTDADIIVWMETKKNKVGYLKEIIRKDMERNSK